MNSSSTATVVHIHLADCSIESFAPPDEANAKEIWRNLEPRRLFAQQRVVIGSIHSKSVFVCSEILRIDFIQQNCGCWEFPEGYVDMVELSEADFRKLAHLGQPELMPRREHSTPVGDLLVSFLKLHFTQGPPIFVMVEVSVKLPAESQSFMRFLLSKTGFHMRLRGGGLGVVNLAHLAGYTVYPGVAQIPADAWIAEPVSSPYPEPHRIRAGA
jgi:hypothetical protein